MKQFVWVSPLGVRVNLLSVLFVRKMEGEHTALGDLRVPVLAVASLEGLWWKIDMVADEWASDGTSQDEYAAQVSRTVDDALAEIDALMGVPGDVSPPVQEFIRDDMARSMEEDVEFGPDGLPLDRHSRQCLFIDGPFHGQRKLLTHIPEIGGYFHIPGLPSDAKCKYGEPGPMRFVNYRYLRAEDLKDGLAVFIFA